jgi:ribonuclease P protein component
LGKSSFHFQKADRILARADFTRLARSGQKVADRYFIFIYSPGLTDRSRIGITVSRKVGKASRRNRIKRLAREYFRHNRYRLKHARDINVIAKYEAAALTTDQVFSSLEILFKKLVHDPVS